MMTKPISTRPVVLALWTVVCCCVLGFYQTTAAAPKPTVKPPRAIGQPLADLVRLQSETLRELQAIRGLMEKQNKILERSARSGNQDDS